MVSANLVPDRRQFTTPLIDALLGQGWSLIGLPEEGRLSLNRQHLILRLPNGDTRLKLHIYKVTGTGRGRVNERRIEITTTYPGGNLQRSAGFDDVVLGYDADRAVYVGFDPERLNEGGPTHNASSFFDATGLEAVPSSGLLILPRVSGIFGIERHAFFRPTSASEYLLNHSAVHAGSYRGGGLGSDRYQPVSVRTQSVPDSAATGANIILGYPTSTPTATTPDARLVVRIEAGTSDTANFSIAPHALEKSLMRARENGVIGEKWIYDSEVRRLSGAGRVDLASQVEWTSQMNVAAGFDIRSFEPSGDARFIEVKSTQGAGTEFQMSSGEWRAAEQKSQNFLIARVTRVRSRPTVEWLRDPVALLEQGRLIRSPDGYLVTVVRA